MAVINPWARHYQAVWENRSANPDLPMWARVVSLAYGRHEANGHARLERGALTHIMGKPPKDGEPFRPAPRQSVYDAIKTAVRYGWLDERSCLECLVVPGHAITGPMGNAHADCPVHVRKAKGAKVKLTLASLA